MKPKGEGMGRLEDVFLIQNPYHPYAYELIKRVLNKQPHLLPVVFYTNPRLRFYFRNYINLKATFPNIIEYEVKTENLTPFISFIQQKYNIVGLLPWNEQVMDTSVALLEQLKLSWNKAETIALFRDKYSLKNFLFQKDQTLLPSPSKLVHSYDEFLHIKDELRERFVIKPNSGYSNQCIGFFDHKVPISNIKNYFENASKYSCFTIEELLEGEEYAINGQVDDIGKVELFSIFHYHRVKANGRANVYAETWNLSRNQPEFDIIESYAKQVIKATGLVRCPFHMEVINDKKYGPMLIEVGCRPGGGMMMLATNDIHNKQIDVFDIAAHYYLHNRPYGGISFNWEYGNTHCFLDLDGISSELGIIYRLDKKRDVEKLTEFVRWTTEPSIGQKIYKTIDLETLPWALHLFSDKGETYLRNIANKIREDLVLNSPPSFYLRNKVWIKFFLKKILEKLAWWKYQLLSQKPPYEISHPTDQVPYEELPEDKTEAS